MIKDSFADIHLTYKERRAMCRMFHGIHVKVKPPVKTMISHGFAEYTKAHVENHTLIIDSNRAKLTEKGIAYMRHCRAQFVKDYLFDIVNFCVALAALILSILK